MNRLRGCIQHLQHAQVHMWKCLLLTLALMLSTQAMAEVPIPRLTAQVVDTTGSLSTEQKATLIQKLQTFEASKGSQIAVLLVQTTQPESIEQYALRVAEQWKIGRGKIDDGAILLLALQDRTVRIEVGYGLEGALTDITAKRIVEDFIIPRLRQGDLAGGINIGVERMINVIEGEPLPPPSTRGSTQTGQPNSQGEFSQLAPLLFMLALFIGGGLRRAIGKLPAAGLTGAVVFGVAWFLAGTVVVALLAAVAASILTLSGVRMGGIGAGRGGFGGGFGRGGGGGFGGGGGGFGGGGASGRW